MANSTHVTYDAGRTSYSSGEEGIYFGRRTPGLRLELPMVTARSCSGSSSQLTKVDNVRPQKDFKTYDEFCSMLREYVRVPLMGLAVLNHQFQSDYELTDEPVQEIEVIDECASPVNPRKFSLIDNWRIGINDTEVGPPKSPCVDIL